MPFSKETSDCPSDSVLARYLTSQLADDDFARIEQHVEGCFRCQETLRARAEDTSIEAEEAIPSLAETDSTAVGNWPQFQTISKYTVQRQLGAGAFGCVYLAVDPELQRQVAIKVIRAVSVSDQELFLREAQALAALSHANIVPVYDYGSFDGFCFLVSAFVDGKTLAQQIDVSAKPSTILEYVEHSRTLANVARALQHAHEMQIFHCDLKPANILIDQAGKPFLVDFGMATRAIDTRSRGGTPAYMSPEQAAGRSVHGASDIFSLGVILYETLTRVRPFQGSSRLEVLEKIQNSDVAPLRQLNPGIPRELQSICARALEKSPHDRYETALDLAQDLEQFAIRHSAKPRQRAAVVLAMVAAILFFAGGVYQYRQAENDRRQSASVSIQRLLTDDVTKIEGAINDLRRLGNRIAVPLLHDALQAAEEPDQRAKLAIVLDGLGEDQAKVLMELVNSTADELFFPIFNRLRASKDPSWMEHFRTQLRESNADSAPVSDVEAKRLANLAIGLLVGGDVQYARANLREIKHPQLRTYTIHCFPQYGIPPDLLIERLSAEDATATETHGILISLGLYDDYEMPLSADQSKKLKGALDLLRQHPDAGVHSAVEWLANQQDHVNADSLSVQPQASFDIEDSKARWRSGEQGHTLSIFTGPVEFQMGTPFSDPSRGESERPHVRRIPRSFAIATKEVTISQFRRFIQDREFLRDRDGGFERDYADETSLPNQPQLSVSWFLAAAYCNWLSREAGIEPSEWCYLPNRFGYYSTKMKHADGFLNKRGYRLPTEAEWEFACRSGSDEKRSYGNDDSLLRHYAWFKSNDTERETAYPVAQLIPNRYGMFDMLGNCSERCTERTRDYGRGKLIVDLVDYSDLRIVESQTKVRVRGASFADPMSNVRSAKRYEMPADGGGKIVGFRIAKTITPDELNENAKDEGLSE